jgi:hypothetical protein
MVLGSFLFVYFVSHFEVKLRSKLLKFVMTKIAMTAQEISLDLWKGKYHRYKQDYLWSQRELGYSLASA